ncbi:protein-disulfide reductase DsbD family protein [Litoricolaceae bacterium]|nr:protein-disulfide reductase DsbD family protein [Litorivicinaceae bacterium]MDB2425098.1 protein-disulfide reductase DsbD family protein [Litorivicinaceae bacterium]
MKWILKACIYSLFAVLPPLTQANQVTARVITPVESVVPGETLWFGLSLEIADGWNTYWKNAGSTGLPPTLELSDGQTEIQPELLFPAAKTKPFGEDTSLLTYGYMEEVLHPFQVTVPESVSGQWSLTGEARWLVCREICIPESQVVSLSLPVVGSEREMRRTPWVQKIDAARAAVPTDFPATMNFAGAQSVWISGLTELNVKDVMPETAGETLGLVQRVESLNDGVLITFDRVLNPADFAVGSWVVGLETGSVRIPFDPLLTVPSAKQQNLSLGLVLLMALAGGLILNLMPCVFPVLSIKALSIAGKASKERREVQRGAWLYTAGILVTMLVLASIMVGLKAGGAQIGWGFQLQTPWFVGLLVYVFVILGLWLYGWVEFGMALSGVGQNLTEGHSGRAEFFTGVLAVVVATPCTAPFMGVAMGYTLTQPWWITLIVFSALGLGLALPMLVFALRPQLASRLPRPGHWMIRLKQFLAFPILATAIWLLWVLVRQTSSDVVALMLGGLLLLVFGLWLVKGGSRLSRALGLLAVIASLSAIPSLSQLTPTSSEQAVVEIDSEPYASSALRAHVDEGRTVFINMTADWCITCKVTEKRLLTTEAVDQLFESYGVIRMTGDWTRYDPLITEYLNAFDRVGVPLYVVNHPGMDPIVLSQFPSFEELEKAIKAKSSL